MEIGASMMAEHVLTCLTGTPVTEATSVVAETIIECLHARPSARHLYIIL